MTNIETDTDQDQVLGSLRRQVRDESAVLRTLRGSLDSLEAQGRPPRSSFVMDAAFLLGMSLFLPLATVVIRVCERLGR
jgi:hypothetical protein